MKKLLVVSAMAVTAAIANAASVGWSLAAGSTYGSDAYAFFIIGQNGVTGTDQISELLASSDAGKYTDYAFGTGTTTAAGAGIVTAANSGKSLSAGTYTSFFVLFDEGTLTEGSTKYTVVSGQANLTKTFNDSAANVSFASGNVASSLASATWSTYGAVPEPTSGLLMLVGLAGLALKRKRA